MNWPYTEEHTRSCKVLYYADPICHHYSQYWVTATRWMWPWGAMKEAWSNLMWVMIVSVAPGGPGNGLHYTMQHQPFSHPTFDALLYLSHCLNISVRRSTRITVTIKKKRCKVAVEAGMEVLCLKQEWPKYLVFHLYWSSLETKLNMESIQLIGDFKWNCACPVTVSKLPCSSSRKQMIVLSISAASNERLKFLIVSLHFFVGVSLKTSLASHNHSPL